MKKSKTDFRSTVPTLLRRMLGRMPDASPSSYEYRVETTGGPLDIEAYEDYIVTRFDEPKHGFEAVRNSNSWSGKWNFHGEGADKEFERRLKEIIL